MGIISLAAFMLMAITGLLLIWKKNSSGYLLADTRQGTGTLAKEWVSIDSLQKSAIGYLSIRIPGEDSTIDRIDVRPGKGVAKVTFKNHYTAIQVDLTTGLPLHMETRRADFIEHLHDGSLFDDLAGTGFMKLLYGSLTGLMLIFLSVSGFFLWYNPKKIRKIKFNKISGDR